jgi:hypothetical protein
VTARCCKDCTLLHMSQIYHYSHVKHSLTVIIEFEINYRVKTELELSKIMIAYYSFNILGQR